MNEQAILFSSAASLAQQIRQGKVAAADVLAAHLDHITRLNPQLNALVMLDTDRAQARARAADAALARGEVWGPLHGVPLTIKDSYDYAGMRSTYGYEPLADYRPERSATAVQRLLDAGAVIMGKSNLPELAFDWQSDNKLFGRSNNPWDLSRTPGGSSGGGGAAVAAGLTPLELGSDGAGSLRVPAHFCGVLTLKPTEGRISGAGHLALPDAPRSVRFENAYGPLAFTVADLRLALTVLAGPDRRQPEVPPVPLARPPARALRERRFVWSDRLGDVPVTAETRAAVAELAEQLAGQGCVVEKGVPSAFDLDDALLTWGEIMGSQMGVNIPFPINHGYRWRFRQKYGRSSWTEGVFRGLRVNLRRLMAALERRDRFTAQLDTFLADWDGWLLPVASTPAFSHRATGSDLIVDGQDVPYTLANGAYCSIINLSGHPAVTLPVGQSAAGLPIGVQLVGRRWADMDLLDIAEQIEALYGPWRRPPLVAN